MTRVKRVNNKAVLRIKGWILAGTVLAGGLIAYFSIKDKQELPSNVKYIELNNEENSEKTTVLKYVEVGSRLEELNLDNYFYDGELPTEKLDSPDTINNRFEELLKSARSYGNDLNRMQDYISDILYLKGQKVLIDKYMDAYGNRLIYDEYVCSLKNYAAKLYDFEDSNNIIFWQYTLSTESPYMIIYTQNPKSFTGVLGQDNVDFKDVIKDKKILDGIEYMVRLQNVKGESYSSRLKTYITSLDKANEFNELASKNQKTN